MVDQTQSTIIANNPIGEGLDEFRNSFNSICRGRSLSCTPDSLDQLPQQDIKYLTIVLLAALQKLHATPLLRSKTSYGPLSSDLEKLISVVYSNNFHVDRINPLLTTAITDNRDDALIWDQVYDAVTESTPPPRLFPSTSLQTPWLRNTNSLANSSEHRKYMDAVLKEELGTIYVGLPDFYETFLGDVADLETASKAVFKKCTEGRNPLYRKGWSGWPKDANQDGVLDWFADLCRQLAGFAGNHRPEVTGRRPLAQPSKPIEGSTAERKLDIGFVSNSQAGKDSRCHWSQILIPGELKSNPSADIASKSWLDLGRYAREVLAAQDTRRFVLGFTICGSLMRIWEFDRLGAIASKAFDINKDGLRFVSTILAFLWMNTEQLGFDPTFITENGQQFIEIQRNGYTERLIIDRIIMRARCISGRATTCWKAHREGGPQTPLVIKDSWQDTEREEEGELLKEATEKDVINVARYYHHEIVRILGTDDDIQSNVRKGIDIMKAENYRSKRSIQSSRTSTAGARKDLSSSIAGSKRSSSQTGAPLPPSKQSRSKSRTNVGSNALPNRVHRRVIISDYGKPIYKASSPAALLAALKGCIEGHESLHKVGFLHRDISVNNLMINEDEENPSWPSFLIDLDLGIKETRSKASGAKGRTGTRAFMAIGALFGEQHSFMHDLESIFWVLIWICIHCDGPSEGKVVPRFEKWNYVDMEELAQLKLGAVATEAFFTRLITQYFTPYFEPLTSWVNRLRKVVFPGGRPHEEEDERLYPRMKEILQEACEDLTR